MPNQEQDIRVTSQPVDQDGNIIELEDETDEEDEVEVPDQLPPMKAAGQERVTPPLNPRGGGGGGQQPPPEGDGGDDGGDDAMGPFEPPSAPPGRGKKWSLIIGALMLAGAWWLDSRQ